MTVIQRDPTLGKCTVRLESRELDFFREVLLMYPMQQGLLKETDRKFRKKLEAALAEKRSENALAAARFRTSGELHIDKEFNEHWDLPLNSADIENLLQILNDVRVGLWIKRGRGPLRPPIGSGEFVREDLIMHLCAEWQFILIHAFEPLAEP
jgi:hypothetical protein